MDCCFCDGYHGQRLVYGSGRTGNDAHFYGRSAFAIAAPGNDGGRREDRPERFCSARVAESFGDPIQRVRRE